MEDHRTKMQDIDLRLRRSMRRYFESIYSDEAPNEELLKEIQALEQEKITVTYEHFSQIKALCNPEQLELFPEVMERAIAMILGANNRPPPPHGMGR